MLSQARITAEQHGLQLDEPTVADDALLQSNGIATQENLTLAFTARRCRLILLIHDRTECLEMYFNVQLMSPWGNAAHQRKLFNLGRSVYVAKATSVEVP